MDPSALGIEKIVNCKVENGHQKYLVQWSPTWEDAESLYGCQDIIDHFWGHVNSLKRIEHLAEQHTKKLKKEPNDYSIMKLSSGEKSSVMDLISRTSSTSVGSSVLQSPSSKFTAEKELIRNTPVPVISPNAKSKAELDKNSNSPSTGNAASLKYIESFSNPYVKLIIVCKICSKEASKFARNWKSHYMSHMGAEDKPHQCSHCSAGFIRADILKKHIEKKHVNKMELKPDFNL